MNEAELPRLVELACQAHWPSWNQMRPDLQRKWRVKMTAAIRAVMAQI